ncbi:hypothetical protein [Legionella longbeachae]|uniref:T2SS substrate NttA domain-containing protein n=1 Tax=Legionella longbeachae serogroup 1 (strain NSW150) TaxID=661367 RepID=D3HSF3_LEGLN|nr:hypothetical protein [Legionella longbeachae]VEE02336.1 Uncharacterised protein [Legionella oakridgensis]HBD7398173.1 hypothetical protein [Legionella pneumophila]ARB91379.1 hypothetical protein A6J40_03870 [Legionella longbeachae]ARM32196.1 hypothetical protein B0B39_01010 [Legionella longbeachae]EEZ95024.1 putative lipoprotein [Legionella longbeachae D-4968]
MSRLIPAVTAIFMSCTLLPYAAQADSPSTASTTSTDTTGTSSSSTSPSITKDEWFKSITPLLPDLICKGFENDAQLKKRLDDIKMTHEQCLSAIPESVSKCQQELYAKIPDKLTDETAANWGKALGECIGKDFAIKYLIPKS